MRMCPPSRRDLCGTISGAATNVNTFTLLRSATGITGTPDGTKFLR